MIKINGIPAFSDNYIWTLESDTHIAVVDPGESQPVIDYLTRTGKTLCAILVTHHHADHIGGIEALQAIEDVPVFAPALEEDKITMLTHPLMEGSQVSLPSLSLTLDVLEVGGHTKGHVAFHCPALDVVFCGDTLFAGGCGRIFEGTPEQMWHSLSKLAQLPGETKVYCAHEYTASNMKFALAVEPGNQALQARNQRVAAKRAQGEPTVPSLISDELATNPFLRWDSDEVIAAARTYSGKADLQSPVEVFAAIRAWKNVF